MGRIDKLLDGWIGERCKSSSPGVALLVLQDGMETVQLVRGAANVETGTPISVHSDFDAGSIAKTVTGICIALLEDEGALSLETSVREFLTELPNSLSRVNVSHLLRHESGLHNYSTMLYFMSGWHPHEPPTPKEVLRAVCRAPGLKWLPGSRYEYLDSNYFLLAQIVERASGMSFGAFAQERVFQPLGMKDSFMTDVEAPEDVTMAEGYASYPSELRSPHAYRTDWKETHYSTGLCYRHVGAEGFRTSVSDLATLGRELLDPSVFRKETVARVVAPSRVRGDGLGYGYGLNAGRYLGLHFFGHDGMIQGFTGSLSAYPEHDLLIACLTNREDLGAWEVRDFLLREILEVESPSEAAVLHVRGAAPIPPLGLYLDRKTSSFLRLTVDEDDLQAEINGEASYKATYQVRSPSTTNVNPQRIQVQRKDGSQSFDAFIETVASNGFDAYAGSFHCDELQTTFHVEATEVGIRLTNADPKRPSMDLDYTPTIQDYFWSHDPHPGISQLEFLRESDRVVAFRYRDYDGDRREVFVFKRR